MMSTMMSTIGGAFYLCWWDPANPTTGIQLIDVDRWFGFYV